MRVGDTEREQALSALGEHMSAGRLDIDEYGDRSARVTAARTRGELLALFNDLPEPKPVFGARQPVAAPAATRPSVPVAPSGVIATTGEGARRSMTAVAAVSWPVAIGIGLVTRQWEVMAVPVLLSWFGGALWGKRWNHDRRKYRGELRDERRDRRRD
jgi:DUF1707 SHOCT-like domain